MIQSGPVPGRVQIRLGNLEPLARRSTKSPSVQPAPRNDSVNVSQRAGFFSWTASNRWSKTASGTLSKATFSANITEMAA